MSVVITDLKGKRIEKQKKFERKVLRELSLRRLKEKVNEDFQSVIPNSLPSDTIEGGIIDVGIESYLLGASMGKFGYYGESIEASRARSMEDQKYLITYLYDYVCYWGEGSFHTIPAKELFTACNNYVNFWWEEGFKTAEKRYKLRLH